MLFKENSYGIILSLSKVFTPIGSKIDKKFKNFFKTKNILQNCRDYFLDGYVNYLISVGGKLF